MLTIFLLLQSQTVELESILRFFCFLVYLCFIRRPSPYHLPVIPNSTPLSYDTKYFLFSYILLCFKSLFAKWVLLLNCDIFQGHTRRQLQPAEVCDAVKTWAIQCVMLCNFKWNCLIGRHRADLMVKVWSSLMPCSRKTHQCLWKGNWLQSDLISHVPWKCLDLCCRCSPST